MDIRGLICYETNMLGFFIENLVEGDTTFFYLLRGDSAIFGGYSRIGFCVKCVGIYVVLTNYGFFTKVSSST